MLSDVDRAAVDEFLEPLVARERVVGMAVAIGRGDDVEFRAFGRAGVEGARPLDADTIFEIGSITKTFTGLLLATMTLSGEVKLDDPIGTYLPTGTVTPKAAGREITLVDLGTHTARLPNNPWTMIRQALKDRLHPLAAYSVEDLYSDLAKAKIKRGIGERVRYSNLGMGLLGHILGLATGTSWEELVAERICRPLGMSDTMSTVPPELAERKAQGHARKAKPVAGIEIPTLPGAGALRSTVRDMNRYIRTHLQPASTPLAEALEMVQRPQRVIRRGRREMGFAWHIMRKDDRTLGWHNGGTVGFGSFAAFARHADAGIVVLTNSKHQMRVDRAALRVIERLSP